MTTIVPVNPVDKVMVNKTTATVPVNRAVGIVPVKKATAPVNNHTVQDNKVLTTAPGNKATDLINKAAMIIALVDKDPVAMVQDLPVVNSKKLPPPVAAMITLKVAAAALNTEERILPVIPMDPEIQTTRAMDLNKVAPDMDLPKLMIMDLAIKVLILVMVVMTRTAVDRKVGEDRDMERNKADNKVDNKVANKAMEIKADMEGMIAITEGCS